MGDGLMPLYRDSSNSWSTTYRDGDGAVKDVSAIDFRLEFYQDGTCVSLTMSDGISFTTDGTDGAVDYTLSLARTNQFCVGMVRLRQFDDAGSDPVLIHEGQASVEGKSFDA